MAASFSTLRPPAAITLHSEPLTPPSFAPYGTAITSPLVQDLHTMPIPAPAPKYRAYQPPPDSQPINCPEIPLHLPLVNTYPRNSTPQITMFSCFPRRDILNGIFQVKILERHPFTTQTFTPLGLSPHDTSTRYLVIVAPTIQRPATDLYPENPPDLSKLHAYIASGGQAVTYAAGTWHAPMVVLGSKRVDFVVTQFVSGIADEDCQEVLVGEGVGVNVEEVAVGGDDGSWRKGGAKL